MRYVEARDLLLTPQSLEASGWTARAVARAVKDGTLVRVRAGMFVAASEWDGLRAEARHLVEVAAVHERRLGGDGVVSHVSSVVLWEFPLYRYRPTEVHLSGGRLDGHTRSGRPGIARHEIAVSDEARTVVDGVACTTIARTVADVARTTPVETGLSIADAAFRRVAWDEASHTYDESTAEAFRAEVRVHLERHRRARGVRRGRRVLELADGRAQLPGESVSRLRLLELGFRVAGLQTPVPGPEGRTYYPDFDLADAGAWGEFDGVDKYTTLARLQGSTIEEVMLAEKQREDWIRGTTNRRMPRWGSEHIVSAEVLGARLAEFQVFPPR